jgi:hypothetical protein
MIKNSTFNIVQKLWSKIMFGGIKPKLGAIFFVITSIVFIGGAIASSNFNMTFQEGLWWTWIHLMNPGFISGDNDHWLKMITSSIIVFLGMSVIAGIFLMILQQILETILEHLKKGNIPKTLTNHTVLAGYGSQLKYFIDAIHSLQPDLLPSQILVVVPDNIYFEQAKNLCPKGTLIAVDHIWMPSAINRFYLYKAQRIILLNNYGGDISNVLNVITKLNTQREKQTQLGELKIYYELSQYSLLPMLQASTRKLVSNRSKIELCVMNIDNISARLTLLNYPLDVSIKRVKDDSRVVLVFIGWSLFADALLHQVMRIGYYQCPTKIYIAVKDLEVHQEKLKENYPGLLQSDYAQNMMSIEYIKLDTLNSLNLGAEDNVSFAVCGDSPDNIFLKTMDITTDRFNSLKYILTEIPDGSGYGEVIKAINQSQPGYSMVAVGSHAKAFELIEKVDKYAKLSHEKYIKDREDNGQRIQNTNGSYENPADESWGNLDDIRRNWNRSPLDHAEIKLRVLANTYQLPEHTQNKTGEGVHIPAALKLKVMSLISHFQLDKSLNEDIELLSKLEHNRWSGEKFSEGWVWGEKTDKSRKISCYLVPYEQLTNEIQQYDREQVIQQLSNLMQSDS